MLRGKKRRLTRLVGTPANDPGVNDSTTLMLFHPLAAEGTTFINRAAGVGSNDIVKTGAPTNAASPASPVSGNQVMSGISGTAYLSVASPATNYDFGTNQFWGEAWVYGGASGGTQYILGKGNGSSVGWAFFFSSDAAHLNFAFCDAAATNLSGAQSLRIPSVTSAWNHLAFGRDASNMLRVWWNGKIVFAMQLTAGEQVNGPGATAFSIGAQPGGTSVSAISEVIIEKGRCRQTTDFAPRTLPHGPNAR